MTCIVGIARDGVVYMGADSAGAANYNLTIRHDPKLFHNGPVLIGYTTSFRMGQLLQHALIVPRIDGDDDLMRYMCVDFVNAVRECLKAGGYAKKEHEREESGQFLVGVRGRLFMVDCDYEVQESADDYDACGCGAAAAKGSLHATRYLKMDPRDRVEDALEAAERHSIGVRGPFLVLEAGS